MEQRITFVTLAVADVARSRAFFVDGLGWEPAFEGGDVIFLPVAEGVMLSLWSADGFRAEVGPPGTGRPPITLAHNVDSPEAVDEVLAEARRAGAAEVHEGCRRDWGGYSGYFVDPDGFHWEVAHNPSELSDDLVAASRRWLATRAFTPPDGSQ